MVSGTTMWGLQTEGNKEGTTEVDQEGSGAARTALSPVKEGQKMQKGLSKVSIFILETVSN